MGRHELRQDITTKQWVIFAPDRGKRPTDLHSSRIEEERDVPPYDPDCPFCPGNEDKLPTILESSSPQGKGGAWQTRVVPNKFPALDRDQGVDREEKGMYVTMPGYGIHEVIIESPLHDMDPSRANQTSVEWIVDTYHRRYLKAMEDPRTKIAVLFRNHGVRAGTSLIHPHSQLMAMGVVPNQLKHRERVAQGYYEERGSCVYCDLINAEVDSGDRVLKLEGSFLAFIPFATTVPYEIWILPKGHQRDFSQLTGKGAVDFASILRDCLKLLRVRLGNPDYNLVIHSSRRGEIGQEFLHWFAQIRPRLVTPAGFEMGTGVRVNPTLPEDNRRRLMG